MKRYIRSICLPCILLVVVVFSGCDRSKVPGLVRLEGVVTYNGEPLEGAMVNFQPISPEGRTAYATTNEAGRFKVTTIDPDDGIVKGEYKVNISKYVITRYNKLGDGGSDPVAENVLPEKFNSKETPLSINVTAGKLDILFELTD